MTARKIQTVRFLTFLLFLSVVNARRLGFSHENIFDRFSYLKSNAVQQDSTLNDGTAAERNSTVTPRNSPTSTVEAETVARNSSDLQLYFNDTEQNEFRAAIWNETSRERGRSRHKGTHSQSSYSHSASLDKNIASNQTQNETRSSRSVKSPKTEKARKGGKKTKKRKRKDVSRKQKDHTREKTTKCPEPTEAPVPTTSPVPTLSPVISPSVSAPVDFGNMLPPSPLRVPTENARERPTIDPGLAGPGKRLPAPPVTPIDERLPTPAPVGGSTIAPTSAPFDNGAPSPPPALATVSTEAPVGRTPSSSMATNNTVAPPTKAPSSATELATESKEAPSTRTPSPSMVFSTDRTADPSTQTPSSLMALATDGPAALSTSTPSQSPLSGTTNRMPTLYPTIEDDATDQAAGRVKDPRPPTLSPTEGSTPEGTYWEDTLGPTATEESTPAPSLAPTLDVPPVIKMIVVDHMLTFAYNLTSEEDLTSGDYGEAELATCIFLNAFFHRYFQDDPLVRFEKLECATITKRQDDDGVAQMGIVSEVGFSKGAELVAQHELYDIIQEAMTSHSRIDLVAILQDLDESNPFSSVIDVTLLDLRSGGGGRISEPDPLNNDDTPEPASPSDGGSSRGLVAAMIIVSAISVFASMGICYVRHRREELLKTRHQMVVRSVGDSVHEHDDTSFLSGKSSIFVSSKGSGSSKSQGLSSGSSGKASLSSSSKSSRSSGRSSGSSSALSAALSAASSAVSSAVSSIASAKFSLPSRGSPASSYAGSSGGSSSSSSSASSKRFLNNYYQKRLTEEENEIIFEEDEEVDIESPDDDCSETSSLFSQAFSEPYDTERTSI